MYMEITQIETWKTLHKWKCVHLSAVVMAMVIRVLLYHSTVIEAYFTTDKKPKASSKVDGSNPDGSGMIQHQRITSNIQYSSNIRKSVFGASCF